MAKANEEQAPVIIKKVKKVHGHAHHGGSWKIAYADFVTAMMAFFLLLWLLSNTTEEQKNGIADYFSPSTPSTTTSGASGVMGGQSLASDGATSSGSVMLEQPQMPNPTTVQRNNASTGESAIEKMIAKREEERFRQAQKDLETVLHSMPELEGIEEQLIIDITPEGMRIQIVDKKDRSMFPSGKAEMYPFAQRLLRKMSSVIAELPNRIKISGHTDGTRYRASDNGSNWRLSALRANASREVLSQANIPRQRFYEVTGKADTEPLYPEEPNRAENRRISIILMREAPVLPPGYIK